ncbi:hypothetical protein [Salinarchaeum laminariae]|uniref:hypothetical protein n=1 Tax=Salinarchaeum laminariae TaxID=869888 RepID=UPI0020BD8ED9|nr:hypothetical protein [Salinarchaeum laminariae]
MPLALGYSALQTILTLAPYRGLVDPATGEAFTSDGRIALELLLGSNPVLDGEDDVSLRH